MRAAGLIVIALAMTGVVSARPARRAPAVEITESTAVVYAISCPALSAPVWQELDIEQLVAVPGTGELRGVGSARVCGVDLSGSEYELILACERADGVHHGQVASYHASGLIRTSGSCRQGRADGEWNRWRESGLPVVKGFYRHGRKSGKWLFWDGAGQARAVSAVRLGAIDSPF